MERIEGLETENGILFLAAVVAVLKIGRRKEDLAAIVDAISSLFQLENLCKTLVPKPVLRICSQLCLVIGTGPYNLEST